MYKEKYNSAGEMSGNAERDELRARFTGWLDTTLYRAKLKYLEKQKQPFEIISIDDFPADLFEDPVDYYVNVERSSSDFDFEVDMLAEAFAELPLSRREILRMLFVDEKTPEEIAAQLHCTVNYVHLQKSRAIKKLRASLQERGGFYDKR